VIPESSMAFQPIVRKGPPPRSFAVDAHVCIMVWIFHRSTEYKVVARMIGAPLASSPQIVPINRSRGEGCRYEQLTTYNGGRRPRLPDSMPSRARLSKGGSSPCSTIPRKSSDCLRVAPVPLARL